MGNIHPDWKLALFLLVLPILASAAEITLTSPNAAWQRLNAKIEGRAISGSLEAQVGGGQKALRFLIRQRLKDVS